MAGIIKLHIAGVSSYSLVPSTGETGITVTSPVALLLLVFTKPGQFASIIGSNSGMKTFYLNFMLKSLGYTPVFSPLSLIMYIPYVLYAIPSSYSSYYQLGYQYSAMVVGAMYISAIAGLYNIIKFYDYVEKYFKATTKERIKTIFEGNIGEKNIVHVCLAIILIVVIVMMPFGILSPPQIQQLPHGSEMTDMFEEHTSGIPGYLIRLSDNISQNAYILTENPLMPYFSNHLHIYATPFTPGYYNNLSEFQYIVIENNSFWAIQGGNHSLQRITDKVLANGSFSIVSTYRPGNILVLQNNKIKSN